jgi:hypothetical protein
LALFIGSGLSLLIYPATAGSDEANLYLMANRIDYGKKCVEWFNKALNGQWFNSADDKQFQDSEPNEFDKIPTCKPLVKLQGECQDYFVSWAMGDINDAVFMRKIEATNGCITLVGLEAVCQALDKLARRGTSLSDSRKSLMVDCFEKALRSRRVQFLRPAI